MNKSVETIKEYFRLANYITVAEMYLNDNILLSEPLKESHLKKYPTGHFGNAPAINYIYANFNYFIKNII